MKRILFIGPAPQNIGGISIHIRRIADMIKDFYIIDYVDEGHIRYKGIFNLRSLNIVRYIYKTVKADIVHIHSGIWFLRATHIIICRIILRKKVMVTIHRDPNIEPYTNFTRWLLKKCNYAILVNQEGYDTMKCETRCKYVLLPAFLPPALEKEPMLSIDITNWIEKARSHHNSYLMCSNAWNLVLHNGEDLYGLDICIEAMTRLKQNNCITFYLLFIVASNTDQQERMISYKEKIKKNGIEDRVLIWEQSESFVRLLNQCDLVVRTTNTDGDAISIREALYFGKPVLASDVVKRPEGVDLFKTRNVDDLVKSIINIATRNTPVAITAPVNYRALYCKMYDK